MHPLISIVVPVHNAGKFLKPCLDSLLAQTYRPLEIILVDDRSTDNSLAVCQEYADGFSGCRVFTGEGKGANQARWTGVSHSRGEFILCCDSDDIADPHLVEALYSGVCATGLLCSCCRYVSFEDKLPEFQEYKSPNITGLSSPRHLDALLHDKSVDWGLYCKLYQKDFLTEDVFRNGITYNEDLLTNWMVLKQLSGMAFVDFTGYYYRQHSSSMSHRQLSEKVLDDQFYAAERIHSEGPALGLKDSADAFYYEKILYLYSLILRQKGPKGSFSAEENRYRAILSEHYRDIQACAILSRKMKLAAFLSLHLTAPYSFLCRTVLEKR